MSGLFFRSLLVFLGLLWGTGAAGGKIVLLSCNDAATAQKLANKLPNAKIGSWSGEVRLFDNGFVEGDGSYKLYQKNTSPATITTPPNGGKTSKPQNGKMVRLGDEVVNFTSGIKTNLTKLGVSDDIANYQLAPNSKGGAYILQGVIVEPKEVALADEIFNLTNQRCIFPKNSLEAIEGFLENGTPFTMKELKKDFLNFTARINEMSSSIKRDPNFQWVGTEGYLKIPFNSFTKVDGTIQVVTKQYVERQFNAVIARGNSFTIKNDGTVKSITVFLEDGSHFDLDLSKLK